MTFGEIWPEPASTKPALDRAADHNWACLHSIGGGLVGDFRRRADEAYRQAEIARTRGDVLSARKHWREFEVVFSELEEFLAAVAH